jgi:hypothetical protein
MSYALFIDYIPYENTPTLLSLAFGYMLLKKSKRRIWA